MRSGGASGNISCSVFSYHEALLNLTRWAFKNSPRLTFDQPKPYVIVSPAIILGLLEADGDFSRGGARVGTLASSHHDFPYVLT